MYSTLPCDVVVVGAGFAGLMCADRLSRLGYRVVIIEKAAAAIAGTSSRNEGWLHAGTYHALSVRDRQEAISVARRCRFGWEEIQRRFPECVEQDEGKAVAVVPEAMTMEALSRWEEAQVGHLPLTNAQRGQLDDVHVGGDELAFAVDDLGINTRMLAAGLLAELTTRGVRIVFGAEVVDRDGDVLRVRSEYTMVSIEHRFIVCAAGYETAGACAKLRLPPIGVRLWRSHLVTLPGVAPVSAFGVAPGHAAMINHGSWSIIGLNEDATLVESPAFDVDPVVAARLDEAVQHRFPRADLSSARRTACVKVDYTVDDAGPRSLNVRMLPVSENAVVVLPGKMTEAPYSANIVAGHVFLALGPGTVTKRPIDTYELISQGSC